MLIYHFKLFILLFLSLSSWASNAEDVHLCYFSLNNEKEYHEMAKLTQQLNKYSKNKVTVSEYLTDGDARESFQAMVDSKVKCDGLIVSGHHTGSFGGKRSNSTLSIDFLEELSCDNENKEFFNHIKALWLQGCRTLGTGNIEVNDETSSADFHSARVGAVLTQDHLDQSFADLNIEFSNTLDQDNPLSSRYLRVFPRATTFGWTKTAPGEEARSEFSVPFHIAQMAHVNDDRKQYFDNPVGEISEESAIKYAEVLTNLLNDSLRFQNIECGQDIEEKALLAWQLHGDVKKSKKYAFDNSDLNSYQALFSGSNEVLYTAKSLECILKKSNDPKIIKDTLEKILSDQSLIGLTFNSIYELMLRYEKDGDFQLLMELKKTINTSANLQEFLMTKLASKTMGIIRKIDYYAFYKELTGNNVEAIENLILKTSKNIFSKQTEDFNELDYQETLAKSLGKHGIINDSFMIELINEKKVSISLILSLFKESLGPERSQYSIVKEILKSDKSTEQSIEVIAGSIASSTYPIKDSDLIFKELVKSSKNTGNTHLTITMAMADSKNRIKDSDLIFKEIIKSEESTEKSLEAVAMGIVYSKHSIKNSELIFKEIIKSEKSSRNSLQTVAKAIAMSKYPLQDVDLMLKEIIKSDKNNRFSLVSVANSIASSKHPIKDSDLMFKEIIKSDKNREDSLEAVALVIENSKHPIKDSDLLLKEISKLLKK